MTKIQRWPYASSLRVWEDASRRLLLREFEISFSSADMNPPLSDIQQILFGVYKIWLQNG